MSRNDGSRIRVTKNRTTGLSETIKDTPDTKTWRARFFIQDQFTLSNLDSLRPYGMITILLILQ